MVNKRGFSGMFWKLILWIAALAAAYGIYVVYKTWSDLPYHLIWVPVGVLILAYIKLFIPIIRGMGA